MLLFKKEKIKKKSWVDKMEIGLCASFLLPAMSCLPSLSVTGWSQISYWKFCAIEEQPNHTIPGAFIFEHP